MVWIPRAVGAPFMTPVRVHGGGLSCARSGVVDSACRGGAIYDARPRSWWRIVGVRFGGVAPFGCSGVINGAPTFLRRDGGCGGVFIVFAPFRCSGVINGAPTFLRWDVGCGGVFIAFAPFRCSGVINGAPTFFASGMGIPVALAVVPVALTVSPGGVPVRGCGVAAVSVWQSGKIVALKIISIGNFVD